MHFNADFHIHSRYSAATSSDMEVPLIARNAELKGLHIVGSGDATHPLWLKHLRQELSFDGAEYVARGGKTRFLITTELEDTNRVHHVLIFPDLDAAEQMRDLLRGKSKDLDSEGRPHLMIGGAELADICAGAGILIGPSHAFTPWTSVYKEFDSLRDCYKDALRHVRFLELGLSADSDMADTVGELRGITFTTNSDCHSPQPNRLGREFNRLECADASFREVEKAIKMEGSRGFVLNAGLDPREGKYHETACTRCYLKFSVEDANRLKRRCPECNGHIKKGVKERLAELKDQEPRHPEHRPPYMHIVPLAEAICLARGIKNVYSRSVQDEWSKLVRRFGTEINVLVDAPIKEVEDFNRDVGAIIRAFREGRMHYDAGGGGNYGKPSLAPVKERFYDESQKSLGDF